MKFFAVSGALAALLAVVLGAFAAHGLKSQLSAQLITTFQTGVQYQMYHALGILLVVLLYKHDPSALLLWSASFMLAGIILFSGSLYALSLTGVRWFGPITPIGGLSFILGWGCLLVAFVRAQSVHA